MAWVSIQPATMFLKQTFVRAAFLEDNTWLFCCFALSLGLEKGYAILKKAGRKVSLHPVSGWRLFYRRENLAVQEGRHDIEFC